MSNDALKINTVGIANESLRRILANKKFIVKEENNNETHVTVVDPEPSKSVAQIIAPDNNTNIAIVDNIVMREDKMVQTDNNYVFDNQENLLFKKEIINYTFNFEKLDLLKDANNKLKITGSLTDKRDKLIFVYSSSKVGSTALVSSIRLFASDKCVVVHLHNELMLKVLYGVEGVTINEIIYYNAAMGVDVIVIDIYRNPIERKLSLFFEDISSFHFNTTDENLLKYKLSLLVERFNQIYSHIAREDKFLDEYNIETPREFDFCKKYLLLESSGVKYLKLRLQDSMEWGSILSNLLGVDVKIIHDYETDKKALGLLYSTFKSEYRLPLNYYRNLEDSKYLRYFLSDAERDDYLKEWSSKTTDEFNGFTKNEYIVYERVTGQNCYNNKIDHNHYFDEGCFCEGCFVKRKDVASNIVSGSPINYRVIHDSTSIQIADNITNDNNKKIVESNKPRMELIPAIDRDKMENRRAIIRLKLAERQKKELGVNLFKFGR
jgi:hypothetical protein